MNDKTQLIQGAWQQKYIHSRRVEALNQHNPPILKHTTTGQRFSMPSHLCFVLKTGSISGKLNWHQNMSYKTWGCLIAVMSPQTGQLCEQNLLDIERGYMFSAKIVSTPTARASKMAMSNKIKNGASIWQTPLLCSKPGAWRRLHEKLPDTERKIANSKSWVRTSHLTLVAQVL